MKKLLFLTVFTMLFAVNAAAETKKGNIGTIIWTYDTNSRELTLDGSGEIPSVPANIGSGYFATDQEAHLYKANVSIPGYGDMEMDFYINNVVVTIKIIGSITKLGDFCFEDAKNLKTVIFNPQSQVIEIGDHAFSGCTNLNSYSFVNIPENIEIHKDAFIGCPNLSDKGVLILGNTLVKAYPQENDLEYEIPSTVTKINIGAFSGHDKLTEITIPTSVTTIGKVFDGCSNLKTVTFSGNINSIGNEAFTDCSNLTTVTFSGTINSIGDKAFANCSSLHNINIPSSVTTWGKDIFSGCTNLPNDGTYRTAGNHVIVEVYDKEKSKYTIEEGIKYIADDAFTNCTNIKYIECKGNSSPLLGDNALPTINYTTIVTNGCEANYSSPWKNVNTTKMSLTQNKLTTCTFLHNARIPAEIAVYRAETEDNDIKLYKINPGNKSCIVPAGDGIILKAYNNVGEMTFENAGKTDIDFETYYGSNKLMGCLEDTPLDEDDYAYGLATINGVQKFLFIDIATTMPVGKAYLNGKGINTNSARILYEGLTEEDMETDIDEVNASETSSNTRNAIYNLAGQKLTHAQNGLNIVNGKIVIK